MTGSELRKLIGSSLYFRGSPHLIIEVLDADSPSPLLVLRAAAEDGESVIQGDQWGDAHRRVPGRHILAVYDDEGELRPEVQTLLSELGLGS